MSETHFDFDDFPGSGSKSAEPRRFTYTIAKVETWTDHLAHIYLEGEAKPFMPLPADLFAIAEVFGEIADNWVGEQITLQKIKVDGYKKELEKSAFQYYIKATAVGGPASD